MPIRIPTLTDLSDSKQVKDLNRTLKEIRDNGTRTAMPVESRRPVDQKPEGHRFRVIERTVSPSDPTYDTDQTHEVHFFVGGKWMRVMLEEVD